MRPRIYLGDGNKVIGLYLGRNPIQINLPDSEKPIIKFTYPSDIEATLNTKLAELSDIDTRTYIEVGISGHPTITTNPTNTTSRFAFSLNGERYESGYDSSHSITIVKDWYTYSFSATISFFNISLAITARTQEGKYISDFIEEIKSDIMKIFKSTVAYRNPEWTEEPQLQELSTIAVY